MTDVIPCGLCFDYAIDYAKEKLDDPNVMIVHGILSTQWDRPFWHGWVEDNGRVFDWQRAETRPEGLPIDVFRNFFTRLKGIFR